MDPEATSDAEIEFEVTNFINILTAEGSLENRNSGHRMKLKRPHPKVSIDPNDADMLIVKSPGARLRFEVSPSGIFPIGIAFQLREGVANPTDLERLGFLNFKQMQLHPEGNRLSVTDAFKDDDANDRYKFSMIVQRASDGAIAIVDPASAPALTRRCRLPRQGKDHGLDPRCRRKSKHFTSDQRSTGESTTNALTPT